MTNEQLRAIAIANARARAAAAEGGQPKGFDPSIAARQAEEDQRIRDELKASGGILENIGAGMNKTVQGVKQLAGFGETDEEIETRRALDEQLAEGQTGGDWIQMGGEMLAQAPITGGLVGGAAKGLKYIPKLGKALIALGSKGGRIANVGTMTRGAAEGAVGGALNATTEDESTGLNATMSGMAGAAVPAAMGGAGKLWRALSKKNAPNRAARIFEKQLGPELDDVNFVLDNAPANKLPLSTAARAQNPKLAALERGARGRSDWGFNQDRKVSSKAWDEIQAATGAADELPSRVADREFLMDASKENLDKFTNPRMLDKASKQVSKVADELRASPVGRQNPDVARVVNDTDLMLQHPERTGGDYAAQYWRISELLDKPMSTESQSALLKLRRAVADAADTASGGKGHFTDMLERYKVEQGLVNEAEATQGIRRSFVDETGVPQTRRHWGDTPEIDSQGLRKAVSKYGKNQYGDTLDPATRKQLSELEEELGQHELFKPSNSPGLSNVEVDNPLSIISSGRDNPFNYWPIVKGGANWLFHGSRKATTEAADEAMQDPQVWKAMMESYSKSKSPLSPDEYAKRMVRQLMLLPGRAASAEIGD